MTTLVLRDSPFAPADKWYYMLEPDQTVLQLLQSIRGLPVQVVNSIFSHGCAAVGGVPIPRAWWGRVRVKADSQLFVAIEPKGGGDKAGGKDIITTVGTLALIAGAALISGGALAPLGATLGFSLLAGSFGAQALALGFTVLGSLALNALAPPPIAPNVGDGNAQAQKDIAGVTGNPLGRREYLPRVLGTMRASPPHLMWPYTELVDGDLVANAVVGLAGRHSIEDIQLAGAPIDDFDGITWQTRTGDADDARITLFDEQSAIEQGVNETLSEFQLQTGSGNTDKLVDQDEPANSYPKWKTFKTRGAADRVDIRLMWPSSIQRQTDQRAMQPVVFQFRQAGSSTWLSGPELWFSDPNAKNTQKRQHIRLIWQSVPLGLVNPNTDKFSLAAYGDTPETFQWKPESYFAPSSGYYAEAVNITDDGYEIYLDPATYPQGQYEVRVKRGLQISYSSWTLATYVWSAGPARWYDSISSSAPWLATNNQDDQIGPVVVETFLTRSVDYPFTQPGLTLIAIRAIGVRVDQVSALFTAIVPGRDRYVWHFDVDDEDWTGTNATLAVAGGGLSLTPSGTDPQLLSPAVEVDGALFATLRLRIREISAATSWNGMIYFSTNGHGFSESYRLAFAEPDFSGGGFVDVDLDMSSLTAGGSDWTDSTITQFRIDLDDDAAGTYEIDYIAIGRADGDSWVDVPTRNPAALYRHVLASDITSKPLPDAAIDDAELVDWHDRCLAKGYECNATVQGYSVDQVKQIVASGGWALPQQSEKWGVVQERDLSAEAPTQLFTQRNTRNFTVETGFADLPHAIVAEYFNQQDDYKLAEKIIYFPGYNALNTTLFETLRYDGNTLGTKVIERAGLDRDQLLYRSRRISFDADMAHLVSPRGTLVAISNDTLGKIYDAARIVSVTMSGDTITGLVLDAAVVIEAAPLDVFSVDDLFAEADIFADSSTSGITIQCDDATTLTLEIDETSDTDTVTLTTPLADPGTITAGLTVAVGRLDREHIRARILSIERVKDYNARITVLDEAPQIHA